MTGRKVCGMVKTGKAAWWVSLISVGLQPSWLPVLLASLASAGWLLCPHLTLLTQTHTETQTSYVHEFCRQHTHGKVVAYLPGFSPFPSCEYTHVSSEARELFPLCSSLVFTSCLSCPSGFSSRASWSFHHKAICKAFNCSVLVCLSWIGA